MPPTPTLKNSVHFDGQLEHIRLFHKEQKPAAVSREGSPCDTETSDNETLGQQSDMYRSSEDERLRSTLVLETVNIPLRNAMASTQERLADLDVRLEQVVLSKDNRTVEGTVLVRNIAFEKWIAVRFTYDFWQTTSEVTAKYAKSIPEENIDLFSFSIRLPEATKRIEDKRLFFALRYVAAGREAWDNNSGQNYQLRFRTEKKVQAPVAPVQRANSRPPSWPVKSANVDQMADLRKELERVVREDEESSGVQSWDVLTAKLRARNMDIEEDREAKKGLDFRSRYDFGASSKVKWEPPKELPRYGGPPPATMAVPFPSARPTHTKAASISGSPSLQTVSWRSPRGSPRDTGADSAANSPKFFIDPREARHSTGSGSTSGSTTRQRHHQRGGYFDSYMEGTAKAVLTPTTSEAIGMTPSTSTSSTDTVMPSVLVTEDNTEGSSETESTSSSASSSALDTVAEQSQARSAVRFNSYPMDKTYLSPPIVSSGSVSPSSGLQAPPESSPWALSPQHSVSSMGSTPSITSASSPSQSPSSPSELSDSLKSIAQLGDAANRPSLDSVDYSYFLTRFCYYTGHDNTDRHGLSGAYGSQYHRRTQSESTMDGHSPSWEPAVSDEVAISDSTNTITWTPSVRPKFEGQEISDSLSGETTPTRSSTPKGFSSPPPGKTTPHARSPLQAEVDLDLERTPRMSSSTDYFVRPYRGSL